MLKEIGNWMNEILKGEKHPGEHALNPEEFEAKPAEEEPKDKGEVIYDAGEEKKEKEPEELPN